MQRTLASVVLLSGLLMLAPLLAAQSITNRFVFQGELLEQEIPASGSFDMQFQLFDAPEAGNPISTELNRTNVDVQDGLFRVSLNFGPAQFAGDRQWLEIRLRPAGQGSLEPLPERTELAAQPYAWTAAAALVDSVSRDSVVAGSVGAGEINSNEVQSRINATCPGDSAIVGVAADGTVECAVVPVSAGSVTRINTGAGLTGGPITEAGTVSLSAGGIGVSQVNAGEVQRRITGICSGSQAIQQVNEDGSVDCGVDSSGPAGWLLSGNNSNNSSLNFLGTRARQNLVFRVANVAALQLRPNTVLSLPVYSVNRIGGSHANDVSVTSVTGVTIAGGGVLSATDAFHPQVGPNIARSHYGTIGGGAGNETGRFGSAVGAGASTVGGGQLNAASGSESTVSGGANNLADATGASVGGGRDNRALGMYSRVSGGSGNVANASHSVVDGGSDNCAGSAYTWVGGRRAATAASLSRPEESACADLPFGNAEGSFVWADGQQGQFISTGPNRFLVRAANGVTFSRDTTTTAFDDMLRVAGGYLQVDTRETGGTTALCRNSNAQLSACSSSARYKTGIRPLDQAYGTQLTRALRPVSFRWIDSDEADLGFIAEEVAALDARLAVHDDAGRIEGVNSERINAPLSSAVQGLAQDIQRTRTTLQRMQQDSAALQAWIDQLGASRDD